MVFERNIIRISGRSFCTLWLFEKTSSILLNSMSILMKIRPILGEIMSIIEKNISIAGEFISIVGECRLGRHNTRSTSVQFCGKCRRSDL